MDAKSKMVVATPSAHVITAIIAVLVAAVAFVVGYFFVRIRTRAATDCEYAPWPQDAKGNIDFNAIAWGSCSRDCQGGFQYATRGIAVPPTNGGRPCNPALMILSRSCNDAVTCGQPCIPGDPNSVPWVPCPACLESDVQPVMWKVVPPLQTATYGGTDCNVDQVFFTMPCTGTIPPCPPNQDCVYTETGRSACSVPCNSGTQFVFRAIATASSGTGEPCDAALLVTQESCFSVSCPPCDTLFTTEVWSECNAACGPGVQVRFRQPSGAPYDALCPYFETRSCTLTTCPNETCTAPSVDFIQALCYLSCSGYPLPEVDPALCLSNDMFAAICPAYNDQFVGACAPPVPCSVSDWSTFSACSVVACNEAFPLGGTQTRVRSIISTSSAGGAPCTDQLLVDSRPCNNLVAVSYSAWDSVTNGTQVLVAPPAAACVAQFCSVSAWYSVSTCSGGCGDIAGTVSLARSITYFGTGEGACPTDPAYYLSQSACVATVSCTSCTWQPFPDILDVRVYCPPNIFADDFVQYPFLLSLSTYPNSGPCFPLNPLNTCSTNSQPLQIGPVTYPPGFVNGSWSTNTCGAYVIPCFNNRDEANCPLGCNTLVCSGNGIAYGTFSTSPTLSSWCSCSCLNNFSGPACEIAPPAVCPVASASGLICNGIGICSASGACVCPNGDTTPDCTGDAASWCWVYATHQFENVNQQLNQVLIRKLMGAIPIFTGAGYTFSEADCFSITDNGVVDPSVIQSITIVKPRPIAYGFGATDPDSVVYPVQQTQFTGLVQSARPQTLLLTATSWCPWDSFTANLLSQTVGGIDTSQFHSRLLPGTAPAQCESLTLANYFAFQTNSTNSAATASDFSINPVPAGPSLASQTFVLGGQLVTNSTQYNTAAYRWNAADGPTAGMTNSAHGWAILSPNYVLRDGSSLSTFTFHDLPPMTTGASLTVDYGGILWNFGGLANYAALSGNANVFDAANTTSDWIATDSAAIPGGVFWQPDPPANDGDPKGLGWLSLQSNSGAALSQMSMLTVSCGNTGSQPLFLCTNTSVPWEDFFMTFTVYNTIPVTTASVLYSNTVA